MTVAPAQIPIPAWQLAELNNLSQHSLLSGIDPNILAVIDQAESSGSGGGLNSSGYGGFFGLGVNTKYPGGYQVTNQIMASTSQSAFDYQAETAAAEFASLLGSHGGNVLAAEQAYQGGSTEGSSLMQRELGYGPGTMASGTVSNAISPTPSMLAGSTPGILTGSSGGPTIPPNFTIRALLMIVGLMLLFIGIKEVFESGHSPGQTLILPAQQAYATGKRHAQNAGGRIKTGAKTAAEAAAS